jgi:hypothetical protein
VITSSAYVSIRQHLHYPPTPHAQYLLLLLLLPWLLLLLPVAKRQAGRK